MAASIVEAVIAHMELVKQHGPDHAVAELRRLHHAERVARILTIADIIDGNEAAIRTAWMREMSVVDNVRWTLSVSRIGPAWPTA